MTDFVDNGQGHDGGASHENASQEQFAVFNDPIPVQSEDDDDQMIPVDWMQNHSSNSDDDDDENNGGANGDGNPQGSGEQGTAADPNGNANGDDFVFDDEDTNKGPKGDAGAEPNEEELIEKLKAKGFKIEKEETTPESEKEQLELNKIDAFLTQANNFIAQSDELVIREKLKSDLAQQYSRENKSHLIGTEEFEIDLEAEYSEYDSSATSKKLYADSIRRDIRDLIGKNEGEKNAIVGKREKAIQEKIVENKVKVQDSLKEFVKQGVFGVQVTQESAQEIYKFITSGEFTKTVNGDPSLVAKFATYIKNQETIDKSLGGPTYGEGVKAAVDSLGAKKEETSKSPLVHAVNTAQAATGSNNRKKVWGMPIVEGHEGKKESTFVAGAPS